MIFVFKDPTPDREAVIVYPMNGEDFAWPISTEAAAHRLAKRVGAFGFWRLKERKLHKEPTS